MVIAHGAISEMGLIVLGDIHLAHGALGLIVGLAGLAGIIVIHIVATRYSLQPSAIGAAPHAGANGSVAPRAVRARSLGAAVRPR